MQTAPVPPRIDDAPELLDGGHLWLQEFVDGHPFRFRLRADASLRFGDDRREFAGDDAPRAYRHAVHHVQRALDRGALRNAVGDTEAVTFLGLATHRNRLDYGWERLPSVLVTDVHDADAGGDDGEDASVGQFLPLARVEQVAESLGLTPVNAVAKEVRAVDFDPAGYEFPDSAWRDGPVAGVVLRNKTGQQAVLENDAVLDAAAGDAASNSGEGDSVEDAVAEYAPESRYRRAEQALEADGKSVSFDAVRERVLDGVYREHAPTFCDGRPPVDVEAFERGVGQRTSEFLADP
ncbi:hypothetical protein [Halobacterium zhouii]|uniref:hypothetical protein n=1 Tax=Halobacterium zhouii TaxID=2902624 RepID=UPI001E634DEA|nr:hypothetical protein [Halobacterium zhouii]